MDGLSTSPLVNSLCQPHIRIDFSLARVATIYQSCFETIGILNQDEKLFPLQFDLCVAVGKPMHIINDMDIEIDDDDGLPNELPLDYTDCIGDIERRLKGNSIRYESYTIDVSNVVHMRRFIHSTTSWHLNGQRNKRLVVLFDWRYNGGKKFGPVSFQVYFYEPPVDYQTIPYHNASRWCLNATRDWLLPGIDDNPPIGAASSCNGSLLTLSLHVLQSDEINSYLAWNGRMMHFDATDLNEILPKIFCYDKNRSFIERDKEGLRAAVYRMVQCVKVGPKQKLKQFAKQHASICMKPPPDQCMDNDAYTQWYQKLKRFESILHTKHKRKKKYLLSRSRRQIKHNDEYKHKEIIRNKCRMAIDEVVKCINDKFPQYPGLGTKFRCYCLNEVYDDIDILCEDFQQGFVESVIFNDLGNKIEFKERDKASICVAVYCVLAEYATAPLMIIAPGLNIVDANVSNHKYDNLIQSQQIYNDVYIPKWLYALHPPYRLVNTLKLLSGTSLVQPLDPIDIFPDVNDRRHIAQNIISCPSNQQSTSSNQNNSNNNSEKRNSGPTSNSNNNNNDEFNDKPNHNNDDDEKKDDNDNVNVLNSTSDLQHLSKKQLLEIIEQQREIISNIQKEFQQQNIIISSQYSLIGALQLENQKLRNTANAEAVEIIQQKVLINALQQTNNTLVPLSFRAMQDNLTLQQKNLQLSQKYHKMKANKKMISFFSKQSPSLSRRSSKSTSTSSIKCASSSSMTTDKMQSHIYIPPKLVSILNNATTTTLNGKETCRKKTKLKPKPRPLTTSNGLSYEPNEKDRVRKNIFVPRELIKDIKTNITDEDMKCFDDMECGKKHYRKQCACDGLYTYLDVTIAAQFHEDRCQFIDDKSKVFNSGLVDYETKEEMYLVVDSVTNNSKKAKWEMRQQIYHKASIIAWNSKAPSSLYDTISFKTQLKQQSLIREYLVNKSNYNNFANKTKWCGIPLFSRTENNRRQTLFITRHKFAKEIKNRGEVSSLIPILMFNDKNHTYQIHHVLMIEVVKNVNIGISMIYNDKMGKIIVTGIHIDKKLLLRQHQYISLNHINECKCFDNFNTRINDLSIGNPDDQQNRINALKVEKSELIEAMQKKEKELQFVCKYLQLFMDPHNKKDRNFASYQNDTNSMSISSITSQSNEYRFGALDDLSSTSNLSLI